MVFLQRKCFFRKSSNFEFISLLCCPYYRRVLNIVIQNSSFIKIYFSHVKQGQKSATSRVSVFKFVKKQRKLTKTRLARIKTEHMKESLGKKSKGNTSTPAFSKENWDKRGKSRKRKYIPANSKTFTLSIIVLY